MILKHSTFFLCLIIYLSSSIHSIHGQFMIPGSLWNYYTIPYEIDPALASHKATIEHAMKEISRATCIKFVPRNGQKRYLNIKSSKSCNVVVGSVDGGTPLNLSDECVCEGIIKHGLYHAAGAARPGDFGPYIKDKFPCVPLTYNINDPKLCTKMYLDKAEIDKLKKAYGIRGCLDSWFDS